MEHYDLVVIGSGPAGRRAAIQAAKFGYNVLVVERGRRVGGDGPRLPRAFAVERRAARLRDEGERRRRAHAGA